MSTSVVTKPAAELSTTAVYDIAIKTPLDKAVKLSMRVGCKVYLKREDLQPIHSFKLRGAYNKIAQLTEEERAKGVIAASAGNHAQGVALAAKKLGISALIVMPRTTPHIKVDAVKSYGAEVELEGDSYSDAAEYCVRRAHETGRTFIHPFDDPLVIAGQGTIGEEIVAQLPGVTHIFVPVGGGGLIAGIAAAVKSKRPDIKIISVEPEDSQAMALSIKKQERVALPHVGIFADGVAVKQVGKQTFQTAKNLVDDFVTVSTDQICAAIKAVFEDTRAIVEPAGALGVAGIQQYRLPSDAHAVAICSGANMTFERLQQIAERTLFGSGKEAMFAVTLSEKPGALHAFCQQVIRGHNISEFSYRFSGHNAAHVLVGVTLSSQHDKETLCKSMRIHNYPYLDLTEDEITKEHVRHMVGGQPAGLYSEQLYEVIFPERPNALEEFLAKLSNRWNISLFHYRSTAGDWGKVLIGFEADETHEFEKALQSMKFAYKKVDKHNSIAMFVAQTVE